METKEEHKRTPTRLPGCDVDLTRGDTTLTIFCDALGSARPAAAVARFYLRTFPRFSDQQPQGNQDQPCYVVSFDSTLRRFTTLRNAIQVVVDGLNAAGETTARLFGNVVRHLMPELCVTACKAAGEAHRRKAGFALHADIHVVFRRGMWQAARANNALLVVRLDGVVEMDGVNGVETMTFSDEEKDGSTIRQKDCTICLEDFAEGAAVARINNCSHAFHRRCISRWLESSTFCPLCRQRARP